MTGGRVVNVGNAEQLKAALAAIKPDTTIILASGDYGSVTLNGRGAELNIKLVAADAGNPPVFQNLTIFKTEGVHIEGLKFTPPGDAKFANGLLVRGCEDVTVTKCTFEGAPGAMVAQQRGLLIDRSADVVIHDNDFTGLMRGGVVTETTGVKVTENDVTGMRGEGFNFAGVKDVEIAHNRMGDFKPMTGDHPDFIQFWTRGTKTPSENIHIHDNTLIQKSGGITSVQGIFMDNDDSVTYRNVVIEDNVIQTGMPRGITIEQVDGVTIANNVALAVDGSAFRVSVNVIDAVNATVTNNTTNGLILSGTVPVVEASNAIITQQVSAGHRITGTQIESLRAEADIIRGTDGADRMNGTNRNDVMIAGGGNDTISGGRGDDMIIGGGGNNVLVGGSGADTFVFSADTLSKLQSDRLMDLNFADGDKLEFNDFGKSVFDRLKDPSMFNNSDFDVVSIDSASDLASLARLDTVNASRRGTTDTLVLKIADSDGDMLELQLSNMFNQFVQAGGQIG